MACRASEVEGNMGQGTDGSDGIGVGGDSRVRVIFLSYSIVTTTTQKDNVQ